MTIMQLSIKKEHVGQLNTINNICIHPITISHIIIYRSTQYPSPHLELCGCTNSHCSENPKVLRLITFRYNISLNLHLSIKGEGRRRVLSLCKPVINPIHNK